MSLPSSMSKQKSLKPRVFNVFITAHYEVEVEAENETAAETQARHIVAGSTSDGPILGPGSWSFQAVARDEGSLMVVERK